MADERQPYRVFETERDYREHIACIVGWRIGREQRKTEAALERIRELEEVDQLMRELHASERRPRDDDRIRDLLRG